MAAGGFCKLPNGTVVVALNLPSPAADAPAGVRVLVHAHNRARALTRLRNLGLRAVYLRGNTAPPTPDDHRGPAPSRRPDMAHGAGRGVLPLELWHPIRALLRPPAARA